MEKSYHAGKFRLDFQTRMGAVTVTGLLMGIAFFIALVVATVFGLLQGVGAGDWLKGLERLIEYMDRPLADYGKVMLVALASCVVGWLLLRLGRSLEARYLVLTSDAIESRYPIMRWLKYVNPTAADEAFKRIPFDQLASIRTEVALRANGAFLLTVLDGAEVRIMITPGFIGYFDLMEELERSCPHVTPDEHTRLLIDNHRQGLSIRGAERTLVKAAQARVKELMPSSVKRRQFIARANQEGVVLLTDIVNMHESRSEK